MEITRIIHLLEKEIKLEFRQKTALNGILLYVVSSIFICYLSFKTIIAPGVWNALFWVILLFNAINTVSKSFSLENKTRYLYFYTLYSPREFIISKTIYNFFLVSFISLCTYFFFAMFIGSLVEDNLLFFATIILASGAFSSILTLVSAISAKAGGNFTLMAILSFPMTLPLILVSLKISKNAIDGLAFSVSSGYLLSLLSINVLVFALSYLLFPYLWRD